jgi:hypothetical protein
MILCASTIAFASESDEISEAAAAIELSVAMSEDAATLFLTLENRADRTLSIPGSSLPWRCSTSLLLLADEYREGAIPRPLMNASPEPQGDCPASAEAVAPGQALSGKLELGNHFDTTSLARMGRRVVLFWYWRASLGIGAATKASGGFLIIGPGPRNVDTRAAGALSTTAYAMDDVEPAQIGFAVANNGSENVAINFLDLPWLSTTGLIVHAGTLDPPASVNEIGMIRDVRGPKAWVTLPPSGYITGEIALHRRFGSLDEARARGDVVVFWMYDAKTIDGPEVGPQGGYVVFRRTQ